MQDLNVLNLPLHGIRLIEASAGTGKTYNLIIIYLRLLLNLKRKPADFSNPLTIKEILVVTFTNVATQELRTRIKNNIIQFQLDCINGYSKNNIFSKLLLQINDIDRAIKLLSIALQEIDQAAIFTIHGFCQKILTEHTIDLNILFHTTMTQNELIIYQQACSDFWRRQFYPLPLNIISLIQKYWKTPKELLTDIISYIYNNTLECKSLTYINTSNNNIIEYYTKIINYIKNIKNQWIYHQNDIINIINVNITNRKIYNKNNLNRWTNTISQWAIKSTYDHNIPDNLKRFQLSTLKIKHKNNTNILYLFNLIEKLYKKLFLFKTFILNIAINEIRKNLNIYKYSRSEITCNDLIDLLFQNIVKNKNPILIQKILQSYPVAIIDEFQDTDLYQYKIFYTLYSNTSKNSLILIGDPKQAIYGFRGANICTYIKIRQSLPNKYNLSINWRSSPGIVNATNKLFQSSNQPFIFKDIPFIPSVSSYQNRMYKFLIHQQTQPSISFWLQNQITTINNYKITLAKECATVIQNLLSHIYNKTAWLKNNKYEKKVLQTSDITILVKNHEEASLIKSTLLEINIPTIFLSNRQNIFETIESYELLLLLKSVLYPKRHTICTAYTTMFFGLNSQHIEKIYSNPLESQWDQIFIEFHGYYSIWKHYGILSMIQKIIFKYKVPETLLCIHNGKNSLINILHLGELLNNVSQEIRDKYELLQWLELKINQNQHKNESPEYALRFNYDCNLIKISTIHKSKGLEFPITILPFMASFKHNKKIISCTQKLSKSYIDIVESNLELPDKERLSEDLRLLYVAITRSIYHCAIGIAPIIYKPYKKTQDITDLHHSSIGYLIQNKKPSTLKSLIQYLHTLKTCSNGDITYRLITKKQHTTIATKSLSNKLLSYKKWNSSKHIYNHSWKITSYSELKNNQSKILNIPNLQALFTVNLHNNDLTKTTLTSTPLTVHTFPKGKFYGIFFHNLFKILDFKKSINIKWLCTQMALYNISSNWKTIIYQWIYTIINTPLNQHNLTLSKIDSNNKQTEFKFHLNINSTVTTQELNDLCEYYDPLSLKYSKLTFSKITGILKGFIDLIFYWDQKYYLLDYKTNWLGKNNNFYTQPNITQEIIKYRYTLQYQLYTLALHRFLQHKLISYSYEKNFGGIYYLFIRGMDGISNNNGIYFHRPSWEFIKKLDNLFLKKFI